MGLRPYATALALLACAACVPEQQQQQAERRPAVAATRPALSPAVANEVLALDRVVVNIRSGSKIGTHSGCDICGYSDVHWTTGMTTLRTTDLPVRFFESMTAAGYRVAGDPNQMFDRQSERASARYLVGGQVMDIQFRLKQTNYMFVGQESRGEARIKVNWQIYSLRERRVVYETSTEGDSKIDRTGWDGALTQLVLDAFAVATTQLAVDTTFQSTLGRDAPASTPIVAQDSLEIPAYPRLQGSIGSRTRDIANAAVTIVIAGGHGSGFFVSDDGLILTNQHVVGNAEQVSVRLAAGIELPGRVLRRNAVRDVALVKIDIARVRPLPLSTALPAVGTEAYALGSPSDPNLAGTLTRGIVSAARVIDHAGVQLPMIQSDATIYGGNSGGPLMDASGNVIGIAVSSAAQSGRVVPGVNFFIPIDDALRYLNIRLGQPRELRF